MTRVTSCSGGKTAICCLAMATSTVCLFPNRLLVAILKESQNTTAIAVAAHDLGEYVRYYPRGKRCVCGGHTLCTTESPKLLLSICPTEPCLHVTIPVQCLTQYMCRGFWYDSVLVLSFAHLFSSLPMCCRMIENLGAKTLVMELVNHSNTEIRMQALLSIQKMMVQNWSV